MGNNEFSAWMDKQMTYYRENEIPFFGYLWHNSRTGGEGSGLLRLDKPAFQEPIRKPELKKLQSSLRKLEKEFGTTVYTYHG